MSEVLVATRGKERAPTTRALPAETGARAVALCGGCPLAQFCPKAPVAPCETQADAADVQRRYEVESSGAELPLSRSTIRRQLSDETINTVVVPPQKKSVSVPKPILTQMSKIQASSAQKIPSTPRSAAKPASVKQRPVRRSHETGLQVADIFGFVLGQKAVSAARPKK